MPSNRHPLKRRLILCILGAFTLAGITVPAASGDADKEPRLISGTMHFGLSPRIKANSWCRMGYRVTNPSDEAIDVEIILRPQRQRNVTVYRTSFRLDSGITYEYESQVTCGTVDRFNFDFFVNGNLTGTYEAYIQIDDPNAKTIVFVDDADMDKGSFAKNKELYTKFNNTHARGTTTPTHWAAYDEAVVAAFMQPDWDTMTTRQFNAISDYAARGGTVLFADPVGLESASKTVLRKLLPVTVIGVRDIDYIDGIEPIDGHVVTWPAGTPFLESTLREEGIATLWQRDFPLVAWRRYGLGMVGACAVNPSLVEIRTSQNFNPMWNHLLANTGNFSHASRRGSAGLSSALDTLTGIEIPRSEGIRAFLVVYFAVVVVIILIGIFLRQHARAWIVMSCVALIATVLIFHHAARRSGSSELQTAAIINFVSPATVDRTSERLVSLFSKDARSVDIVCNSVDARIRALIPPRQHQQKKFARGPKLKADAAGDADDQKGEDKDSGNKGKKNNRSEFVDFGKSEAVRDPISVSQINGRSVLPRLFLRHNAPRFYAALDATSGTSYSTLPTITWTAAGASMKPWEMPGDEAVVDAFIVCHNGVIPVNTSNQSFSIEPGKADKMMAPSSEILALQKHLVDTPSSAPLLAVVTEFSSQYPEIPDEFSLIGRTIHLIPVVQDLTGEQVHIPKQQIRINPSRGKRSKGLHRFGEWQSLQHRGVPVRSNPMAAAKDAAGNWSDAALAFAAEHQLNPELAEVQQPGNNGGSVRVLGMKPAFIAVPASLPTGLSLLKADRLSVYFSVANRGGNLTFDVLLRHRNDPKGTRDLAARRIEGTSEYRFEGFDSASVIDPASGAFEFVIRIDARRKLTNPTEILRANSWKILELTASASGTLDEQHKGIF
jgi:hypothetical protein